MKRLRVNPIDCDGRGMCAELLPELVRLDEWGYPLVSEAPVPGELAQHARRAVAACPKLALRLVPVDRPTNMEPKAGPGVGLSNG